MESFFKIYLKEGLTFFHCKRFVTLVDAPQSKTSCKSGLGHLILWLVLISLGFLVDKASVSGLVRVDVAVVHQGNEVT